MFYLVQRMSSRKGPANASKGFDAHFELDYMGSSEFEWGAIPKALAAMRRTTAVVEVADVNVGGTDHQIFFVGAPGIASKAKDFESWASGDDRRPAFHGKEWTYLPEIFAGTQSPWMGTDAWWSIDGDVAWALDASVAQKLADAFNSKGSRS